MCCGPSEEFEVTDFACRCSSDGPPSTATEIWGQTKSEDSALKTARILHDRDHADSSEDGISIIHQTRVYRTSRPVTQSWSTKFAQFVMCRQSSSRWIFSSVCASMCHVKSDCMNPASHVETRSLIFMMMHYSCGEYTLDRCGKGVSNTNRSQCSTAV